MDISSNRVPASANCDFQKAKNDHFEKELMDYQSGLILPGISRGPKLQLLGVITPATH